MRCGKGGQGVDVTIFIAGLATVQDQELRETGIMKELCGFLLGNK